MSAVFHPGHPMHVPTHHLHHHSSTGNHHSNNTSSNGNGIVGGGGGVDSNGGPGFMLDDGSGVVGGVGYPHDGMTPPGMVWDPSLQGDGGGKFRLKRRRRCGQCAPCQRIASHLSQSFARPLEINQSLSCDTSVKYRSVIDLSLRLHLHSHRTTNYHPVWRPGCENFSSVMRIGSGDSGGGGTVVLVGIRYRDSTPLVKYRF
ncbi:hypothetical protein ElyMa_005289000 [Elysia marginata]|uniref:Uncharacterized protein n=1 Tax=Elysia marginata TaxID=1093978 RepID=A0AAV4K0X5_9GAST|nr:hypothetical protein ElyMa_005289000 [Elysia marginata]